MFGAFLFNLKRGFRNGPLFLGEMLTLQQLAQVIGPAIVSRKGDLPTLSLYIALIASNPWTRLALEKAASLTCNQCSAVMIFTVFVPSKPPTPPSMPLEEEEIHPKAALVLLSKSPRFWLFFIPARLTPDGMFGDKIQLITIYSLSFSSGSSMLSALYSFRYCLLTGSHQTLLATLVLLSLVAALWQR